MNVCILGAAGGMALGSVRDLIEHDEVSELVLADLDHKAVKRLSASLASDKVRVACADAAQPQEVADVLRGCDVCLNATFPRFNVGVMRACLATGVHYTDYGGLFHCTREQAKLDAEFVAAGLTAVLGSGCAPGISQVLARAAVDRLDTVHTVRLCAGLAAEATADSDFIPPYSLDTILEEFETNPWEFVDGRYVELEPFAGQEEMEFPEPIGRAVACHTIHSEPLTMPGNFAHLGIREVSWKLALPQRFVERLCFLVDLGLAARQRVRIDDVQVGVEVAPRDVLLAVVNARQKDHGLTDELGDHMALRATAIGVRGGRETTVVAELLAHPYEPWHMSCTAFLTGFAAAVTCRMLGNGAITARGANSSEVMVPPSDYFDLLAQRGLSVTLSQG